MSESILSGLATAGDDIKIWDTTSFNIVHQFVPPPVGLSNSNVLCNSWSSDTSCVASVVRGREKVVLTYSKNRGYVSQEIHTVGLGEISWAQFPKTTQKHLMLSSGNEVHVYDISKSKSRKSFLLKSPVTCFSVNQSDSYIAAGCQDGSIALLTLASNQVSSPLIAPRCSGQKVTGLRYSQTRPSFLGTSCESGTVSFWDCNANKNLFNLTEHCAPCTGIAFSPVNETLALSSGLDKKLICHDTKAKKCVMSLTLESPLTAVDFDMDGVTMAVGTSRGKLLVYDLRSPTTALHSIGAHKTSVHSLVYKHRIDKVNISQVMSAVKKPQQKKQHTLSSHRSHPSLRTVQEETKENQPRPQSVTKMANFDSESALPSPTLSDTSVFSTRKDSMSSQLFSPLRETDISFPNNSASQPNSRRTSEVRLSTDGLFSPLKEASPNSSNISLSQVNNNNSNRKMFNSIATPTPVSPLTIIQEESNSAPGSPARFGMGPTLSSGVFAANPTKCNKRKPELVVEKLSLERLDEFVKKQVGSHGREVVTTSTPAVGKPHALPVPLPMIEDTPPPPAPPASHHTVLPPVEPLHSDLHSVLTAFPLAVMSEDMMSPREEISDAATTIADAIVTTADPSVATFQKEYIQSVVSEAMEEWCGGVERRLWGLQYSLLRQLQSHQEETRILLQEAAGINEVKKEMDRLRTENEELKKFFGR